MQPNIYLVHAIRRQGANPNVSRISLSFPLFFCLSPSLTRTCFAISLDISHLVKVVSVVKALKGAGLLKLGGGEAAPAAAKPVKATRAKATKVQDMSFGSVVPRARHETYRLGS